MDKDIHAWAAHILEVKPAMDELAQKLVGYGASIEPSKRNCMGELGYYASFSFPEHRAVTSIKFLLKEWQTDSDVTITNMTTKPNHKCSHGLGSKAVQAMIRWARDNHLNEIRATQVSNAETERFWVKNGFTKCPPPNPCNDFTLVTSTPT